MLPVEERRVHIPAISSGIFGFPLKRCCKVIVTSMLERIDEMSDEDKENLTHISMCNLDQKTFSTMQYWIEHFLQFEDDEVHPIPKVGS